MRRIIYAMNQGRSFMNEQMRRWRNGEISDGEMMVCLSAAIAEVALSMQRAETIEAETRLRKASRDGQVPFSAT